MAYSYGPITAAATSKPIAVHRDTSIGSATSITLNSATTGIEVTAHGHPILLRWDATVSTSAFDGVVCRDCCKVFMVPSGTKTVSFIEESSNATLVVIEF